MAYFCQNIEQLFGKPGSRMTNQQNVALPAPELNPFQQESTGPANDCIKQYKLFESPQLNPSIPVSRETNPFKRNQSNMFSNQRDPMASNVASRSVYGAIKRPVKAASGDAGSKVFKTSDSDIKITAEKHVSCGISSDSSSGFIGKVIKKEEFESKDIKKEEFESKCIKKEEFESKDIKKEEFESKGIKKEEFESKGIKKEEFESKGIKKEEFESKDIKKEEFESQGLKKEEFEIKGIKKEEFESKGIKKEEFAGKGMKKETYENMFIKKEEYEDMFIGKEEYEDKVFKKEEYGKINDDIKVLNSYTKDDGHRNNSFVKSYDKQFRRVNRKFLKGQSEQCNYRTFSKWQCRKCKQTSRHYDDCREHIFRVHYGFCYVCTFCSRTSIFVPKKGAHSCSYNPTFVPYYTALNLSGDAAINMKVSLSDEVHKLIKELPPLQVSGRPTYPETYRQTVNIKKSDIQTLWSDEDGQVPVSKPSLNTNPFLQAPRLVVKSKSSSEKEVEKSPNRTIPPSRQTAPSSSVTQPKTTKESSDNVDCELLKIQHYQTKGERIELCVGGQCFETTKSTLMNDKDSCLAKICENRSKNENNKILIDRDPSQFNYILNYLRYNCEMPLECLPVSEMALNTLRIEAKYYNVSNLVAIIDNKMNSLKQ